MSYACRNCGTTIMEDDTDLCYECAKASAPVQAREDEALDFEFYWQIVMGWAQDMPRVGQKLSAHEMRTLTERLVSITAAVLRSRQSPQAEEREALRWISYAAGLSMSDAKYRAWAKKRAEDALSGRNADELTEVSTGCFVDSLAAAPQPSPQGEDDHEPGEVITSGHCPNCGADLEVIYGEDEGDIGIIGSVAPRKCCDNCKRGPQGENWDECDDCKDTDLSKWKPRSL